jgi:hypothetical protein
MQVVEIRLQLQQLTPRENFVDRHFLSHIPQQAAHGPWIGQGVMPRDPHLSAIRLQEGAENANRRGLTGTIGAQDAIKTARRHLEREVIEGLNRGCFAIATEALLEVVELNQAELLQRF